MASIDGLVTGMSTSDTIAQLMRIEAAPQAALKAKITTAGKVVTAYQSINTRMSSIATAAKALNDPDTWGSMKATSSSDAAVVTALPGAAAGTMSFKVDQLAAAQQQTFTGVSVSSITDATGSPVMSGTSFDVTLNDGTVKQLTPTSKSLQSVIAAINGETDVPYKASAVLIAPGQYTLQLTAKESGLAGAAKVDTAGPPVGLDLGPASVTVNAADAKLTVDGPIGAFEVSSGSNTFADVLPGVTVTATKVQAPADAAVTVTMTPDAEGIAAKIQALVESANTALTEIAGQSKIKSGEIPAGALVGDSAMRKLTQDIIGAVSGGAAGIGMNGTTGSFNEVGIGVDRGGKLTFNKQAFLDTFEADPAKAQKYFDHYEDTSGTTKFDPGYDDSVGLARKLETLALIATEGVADPADPGKAREGILQGLIQRRNDNIRGMNDQVSQWDTRLELRKVNLQKQFSSLEVAMGKMQQQSSWLASQLAGLG
jgi:flagellar hook-associated protein 2